jgi:hypothetical protein
MPSVVSAFPTLGPALLGQLAGRPGLTGVQLSSGSIAPDDSAAETIFLLDGDGDIDWATIGATGRRRDETGRQLITVWTTRQGGGEQTIVAAKQRAFAIAQEIADQLDTDPTANGTVRNARITRFEYRHGALSGIGRWVELRLTLTYQARI